MTGAVRPRRLAAVGAPLVLLVAVAACSTPSAVAANTGTVSRGDVTAGVSASGALSAIGTENLGFATGGKLTSVRVKVGDKVTAGQTLATVDATAAKATLAQAEGNLKAQQAGLDRLISATTVSGAQNTVSQANAVVSATQSQVAATADADDAAISRAKTQLSTDKDARDQAESALASLKAACKAASSGAASANAAVGTLAQQALAQLQSGDSAGAKATLAQLNAQLGSTASAGDASACTEVITAQSAVSAAKQKVVADQTALVGAQQKKKVDAAAGKLAIANAKQGAVAAQNGLSASSADRPHGIDQQQAMVDGAEAAVRSAQKLVDDTTLTAPSDGTVEAINGNKGEYVGPSTATTAQAPGSSAAIPGAAAAAAAPTGASRPGGTQFIVLSDVSKLQLVLPFEQSDAAQLKPNQKVDISSDGAPDATLTGHVVSIAPSGTAASGTISYYATVALDRTDSRLRDGQTARATVRTVEKDGVLSVPNAAVHRNGATTTVILLAADGSQQAAPFEAGVVGSDLTEVLSGLSEGQRVVLPSGAS
ncbi:HlyD family efflux transporter periplasmic adaptor subunit [Microlunatus ginsengisoli]|uniref:CusB-like beta-barrel domain-containing protein n=1 Tax=Microlunatus ginsengisoli TaxID=363863 RepID=A0ABP7AGR1_9ACTN